MNEYINFLILVKELKNNGITKFRLSDLESDLYILKQNPKYTEIFINIKEKINKLDLTYIVKKAEKEGYIISLDYDIDIFYITKLLTKEENKLITELSHEYINKLNRLKEKNIKIYKMNSNNMYTLIKKRKKGKIIDVNIITDGEIIELSKFKIKNRLESQIINIKDSTYVVEQKMINDKLQSSIIYTMLKEDEKIDRIINYQQENNVQNKKLIIKRF